MIRLDAFLEIVERLRRLRWAKPDIEWSENIEPPSDPVAFALELAFVIVSSGMKNRVAEDIWLGKGSKPGVRAQLLAGRPASSAFGHKHKAAAIDRIWRDRGRLLTEYQAQPDDAARLAWLEELPWIGGITKYHAAKNFGMQVAKPDVHLQRLAVIHGTTAQELCADLARKTGYRIATVDLVLWRACAYGVLDSTTGMLLPVERGIAA